MNPNIFDWSNDRIAPEAGDETSAEPQAFARTVQHPLSMRSPGYDMIYAVLGLLSMLNSLFCARLPDHGIKKWDIKTGALMATLEGHADMIRCLAISEKEGAIFSGSGDNSIKKWDIKTGALMATLEGHADEVTCLAISEKEGAIFSGSGDKTIKAW